VLANVTLSRESHIPRNIGESALACALFRGSMLAGEVILLSAVGLAVIALVTFLRRDRIARAAALGQSMYPLQLGLYRGCAFLVVLLAAFAVVGAILTAISRTGTST
jgi:hypothetical protein